MNILVAGASGATGIRLVEELLKREHYVRAIVRAPDKLPEAIRNYERLTVITASVLDLSDQEMQAHAEGCDALASCLGHNLTFKGLYGKPRRLVTEATRRLCKAVKANNPGKPVKFVLMNTVAVRNPELKEKIPIMQRLMISLLRVILPPHSDNEQAAKYLRTKIGRQDDTIEWVAVRPSSLIDEDAASGIELYPSPTRSILKDGQVSRINVGHFMADLITDSNLWSKWKGQMPVIYNEGTSAK